MNQTTSAAASTAPAMSSDAGFSMLAKLLYLLTRLGLPPLILAHVTLTEYGLWSACFVLVGYIALADLGFSSVYVRSAARLHVQGDTAGIGRLLSTGVFSMLGVSVALFAAVYAFLPTLLNLVNIDPDYRATARTLILGSVAVFLFDISLNAFSYVLHGLQRFRAEQRVWVLAFLLELLLIAGFLYAGLGIHALLLAFALRYGFSITCNIWQAYRALPGLSFGPRNFDPGLLSHFLGFGLSVQASTFFSMALHSADRLIAGALLGPQAIALFDLGGKLPVSAASVPAAISQITLPAAARLSLGMQDDTLRRLYMQTTRAVSLVAALPLAFLAVFAEPVSFSWLGPRSGLEDVPLLISLAAVGAFLHIITGPGSSVFRGTGRIGNEFVYHGLRCACLGLGLSLSCLAVGTSLKAIAFGLAGGTSLAACLYLTHNHRRFGLSLGHLLTRILLPALAIFALALALLSLWQSILPPGLSRWHTLAALAAAGLAYSLLAATLLWQLLDADEQAHVASIFGRFAGPLNYWRMT